MWFCLFFVEKKFVDCHVLGLAVYMYSILMSNNIYMYNNQWGDSPLTVLNTCRSKLMYIVWMVQIIRSETTFISISTELFCSYSWVEPVTGQVIFNFYTCCAISLFTAQDFFFCAVCYVPIGKMSWILLASITCIISLCCCNCMAFTC